MNNQKLTYYANIEEILNAEKATTDMWLNFAQRYIRIIYKSDKCKPAAQDIVGDIVVKIHTGERRWDPEKVNLNTFMYNSIRSHVSSQAKKEKRMISTDEYIEGDDSFVNRYAEKYYISKNEIEFAQDRKEELDIVMKAVKGDDVCELVLYSLIDGMEINEIAEYLGITVPEIYNTVRRIKYKVHKELKIKN